MAVNSNDDIYLTGSYGSSVYFGSDTVLTSPSWASNGYIAKYHNCSYHNLDLIQGWSLISSYINLFDSLVSDLMAPIDTSLLIMKAEDGSVYWPQYALNQIGNWEMEQGYQVKMSEAREINFCGDFIRPEETPIPIEVGWQIISYVRYYAQSIGFVFTQTNQYIDIVKNGMGQVYWPQWNIDAIGTMKPGEGYLLKSNTIFNLYYSANQ